VGSQERQRFDHLGPGQVRARAEVSAAAGAKNDGAAPYCSVMAKAARVLAALKRDG
jgi:hypothetical protein